MKMATAWTRIARDPPAFRTSSVFSGTGFDPAQENCRRCSRVSGTAPPVDEAPLDTSLGTEVRRCLETATDRSELEGLFVNTYMYGTPCSSSMMS